MNTIISPITAARRAAIVCVALAAALILGLIGAPPAQAAPIPVGPFTLEVHKFEQPDTFGPPSNGLPQDTTGLTPVPGATFSVKRVPGIDLTSNAGQAQAGALTLEDAALLVANQPDAAPPGTTDGNGNTTFILPNSGLYYVQETITPAGFAGSARFVVALPLTDPDNLDRWLSTVHVYPKNARTSIELDVVDADAVRLGDIVTWRSRSSIPITPTDGYRVVQRIDTELQLIDSGDHVTVGFSVAGAPPLVQGAHYTRTVDPVTQQITIDFLPAGRTLLEQVAATHPGAEVVIEYQTRVLADGDLVNEALLYPSRAAIDGGPGAPQPLSASNVTKWGPIAALVHERGKPSNLIPGARFKLYLTPEDAVQGVNAIEVSGVSEWTTDANGMVRIEGLRFSGFVNGLDRDPSDPLFRYYYLMPTYYPPGWTGEKNPLRTTVFSTVDATVLEVVLWRTDDGLPITGGQQLGIVLLGVLLVGGGVVLLARRRRDAEETAVEQ